MTSVEGFKGFSKTSSPYYRVMQHLVGMPHVKEIFVKNRDDYVKACITLPPINYHTIQCKAMTIIKTMAADKNDKSMAQIINMLHADDYDGISAHFGCEIKTPVDVLNAHKKKLDSELNNVQADLVAARQKTYSTQKAKDEAIERMEKEVQSLKTRLDTISHTLSSLDDDCSICYDTVTRPMLMPCCNNIFCTECILGSMQMGNKLCPMCREVIDMKKITILADKKQKGKQKAAVIDLTDDEADMTIVRPKAQQLLFLTKKIFKERPDARIMFFSEYDGSFNTTLADAEAMGIKAGTLSGTAAHINKNLERFTTGEMKILVLNARRMGAGINIPQGTDLIMYHKMPVNMTMQVICRAQRLGRKAPLNVWYLFTEDEIAS